MLEPNTLLQQRYRIIGLMGCGAHGGVYQALDMRFGSNVALKHFVTDDPAARRSIDHEARALNGLRHPALPHVFDYFAESTGQFLVMQFVPGQDLGALLAERGYPLPLTDVLRWTDHLLDAVDYLHNHVPAIAHGDIKPRNLKLDKRGHLMLVDFGFAVSAGGSGIHYLAPELLNGAQADALSDIYAIGATVYSLVTGHVPPTAASRTTRITAGSGDPLHMMDVPGPIAPVIEAALALERDARLASAAAMRKALHGQKAKATTAELRSSAAVERRVSQPAHGQMRRLCAHCGRQLPATAEFCPYDGNRLPPPELLAGTLIDGKYQVEALIGKGGMGSVYKALHVHLNRQVALKTLRVNVLADAAVLERFRREALTIARLNHPNIVAIYDFGITPDGAHLVMEHLEGCTLRHEIETSRPLSIPKALAIMQGICAAVSFAHSQSVIHRDLKPDNVFLEKTSGAPRVKVLDFGIAKLLSSARLDGKPLTRSGVSLGTPTYMSPQQALGVPVDERSDIYSLGCVLYEMLTGRPPFQAPTAGELLQCHVYAVPDPPGRYVHGLPAELDSVVLKALSKHPDERYQTAGELAAALAGLGDIFTAETVRLSLPGDAPSISQLLVFDAGTQRLEARLVDSASAELPSLEQMGGPLEPFAFEVLTVEELGEVQYRRRGRASRLVERIGDVTLEMVWVPGGSTLMGSPIDEAWRTETEGPQHKVAIAPFLLGRYPVTQALWTAVAALPQVNGAMGPATSRVAAAELPADSVSWHAAVEFCARLERLTGRPYRLPSEAEWEYACRARTLTAFHTGETITPELVNYDGHQPYSERIGNRLFRKTTTPVGTVGGSNGFGLSDMHGNVFEWCADPWHASYRGAPSDGRTWERGGDPAFRVLRGGAWCVAAWQCRSAYRHTDVATGAYASNGLRVALSIG